jgi:hypothetical protein
MFAKVNTVAIALILTALVPGPGTSALAGHSVANEPEPKLEIFPNQQPILIGLGQPKGTTVLGAVYDGNIRFGGQVLIRPNGPKETACPIFNSGDNLNVSAARNTTNLPLGVGFLVPANHPLGNFNCALTYSASQVNPFTGERVPVRTQGNQVNVPYTVKRRFQ